MFYRSWNECKHGFGYRDAGNDFWLGNEQIYYLTNQRGYKLRVGIVTSVGLHKCQECVSFHICDESTEYRLIASAVIREPQVGKFLEIFFSEI
ncbi:Ficolin-1 [Holothuria leucospilota]|uniref:Ficolin-1 n=1 Tax=Holothuria leucospilota TaxID=206669 RepID=A0A9Q1BW55_HOLLE|nr:Ficolin-1 [Holothuria leucospilota]